MLRGKGGETLTKCWWGKLGGMKQLVRSRRRRRDNINMDLQEIGQTGVHWIDLAQDRGQCWVPVNAITNLRVP